jgi:hypothetical protein
MFCGTRPKTTRTGADTRYKKLRYPQKQLASETVVATEFLTSKNNGCVDVLGLIVYLLASGIFDATVSLFFT